jgi:phospholipid/cholesterol/gamma-HCH transport system ATP-binding protein
MSTPGLAASRLSHAEAETLLAGFMRIMDAAAADEFIGRRLAHAQTTLEVHLVDTDPELSFTVLADREPVEMVSGSVGEAEVDLFATMADTVGFFAGELHLAMAIARGDVSYTGPVRKVLRVIPIMRRIVGEQAMRVLQEEDGKSLAPLLERLLAPEPPTATPEHAPPAPSAEPRAHDADLPASELLDRAAEYADEYGNVHEGALRFDEPEPGEFWSIRIENCFKAFGSNRIMNGLHFGIPEGMITLVLGPSGTGKSVLINHLIGLMFPDSGDVLVHGESVKSMTHAQLLEMRKKFGILFQDGALFGSMSVFDNVAFPLREHTDLSEHEIAEAVNRRLADVGLTPAADRLPSQLSGGMRKRAGFARALVLEPEIVIFDEPDSGLDPVRTALLGELIKKMHAENGGTYIVITHDTASVRQIGEYIAVLWKGRIVQSGAAEEMWESSNPFVRQFLNRGLEGPLGME